MILLVATVFYLIDTDAAFLRCYHSSKDFTVTPLDTPLDLLNSPYFDINSKTVIYAFGYTGQVNSNTTSVMRNAYLNYVDANFVLLDWEKEASADDLGFFVAYGETSVPNAKKVGNQLGDAIIQFANAGLDLTTLHLTGHSLGAHLMGYAGYEVNDKGKVIGRITGLDPAGPLFTKPSSLDGLGPSSAAFVVGIHTNPGRYGTTDNVGDVDIWVNCDLSEQPGCDDGIDVPFGLSDIGSHSRVVLIYAEALSNPRAFPAIQASSCNDWKSNYSGYGKIIFIGEDIDNESRGQYYLRTNSGPPYGEGEEGIEP
ncbi:vitellogenin-1-like [Zerene cesonia]|uniref:vitellogenin-1-like n=1 Tax=Zerene cesonia TaxID=33412 RepID=UPI0018E55F7D|nr:vitellogenin-1-like [Zerene cesonia]